MDKIEVTQADRDAAAAVLHDNLGWYRAAPVRAGEMDNDSVVQAFAHHRLATRTDATPVAWMPMESAPMDEQILAAIKVNHKNGQSWWERHIIVIDSETRTISDMDFHHGWEAEDYECWQPLPAAPDHIEEPRAMVPATDVAALVEQRCPSCGVKFREIAGIAVMAAATSFRASQIESLAHRKAEDG